MLPRKGTSNKLSSLERWHRNLKDSGFCTDIMWCRQYKLRCNQNQLVSRGEGKPEIFAASFIQRSRFGTIFQSLFLSWLFRIEKQCRRFVITRKEKSELSDQYDIGCRHILTNSATIFSTSEMQKSYSSSWFDSIWEIEEARVNPPSWMQCNINHIVVKNLVKHAQRLPSRSSQEPWEEWNESNFYVA